MAKLKHNKNNTRIKRKYLVWLKDAKGLSESSIDKVAAAISVYEIFLDGVDFRSLHFERARSFKRFLARQKNQRTGAKLSEATTDATLRNIKAFFNWLADQPGYRSKVKHTDADYFSTSRKSDQRRRGGCWRPHPSPQQFRHVLHNMPTGTVFERRNRALMAFLFLTGSRESAAISICLNHVDMASRCVHFDGRSVDTKFGKSFSTGFFPVGGNAISILTDWIDELQNTLFFGATDPLFPKTKVGIGTSRRFEAIGLMHEPWASPAQAAKIFKAAFVSVGFPPFSPHLIRNTIVELAKDHCKTSEDYKAWSQNLGHDDVLTTFTSYGAVAAGRQMELMNGFRKYGVHTATDDDDDVIEPF